MRLIALVMIVVIFAGCNAVDDSVVATPSPVIPPEVIVPEIPQEEPKDVEEPDKENNEPEAPNIDEYDTTKYSFWFRRNLRHTQPSLGLKHEYIAKFGCLALGPRTGKYVYLTFDEGYEQGYTSRILDVLSEEQVQAAFFVTGQYVRANAQLVKRMYNEGHLIGNHTNTHPSLAELDKEQLEQELKIVDDNLFDLVGEKTVFFRPPMGQYSEFSLAHTHLLGYRTVFWSMAYADWYVDNQPGAEAAYTHVMENIHPGAVILLHAVSESNTEALPHIIRDLKAQGYEFRSLNDFR